MPRTLRVGEGGDNKIHKLFHTKPTLDIILLNDYLLTYVFFYYCAHIFRLLNNTSRDDVKRNECEGKCLTNTHAYTKEYKI